MARLFFALWPDDATQTKLYHVAQKYNDVKKIRLVKQANLHMTLAFLGEVSEWDQQTLLREIITLENRPFKLVLTRIDWWKYPAILYIGTDHIPDPLVQLVKSINTICHGQGLKTDHRNFKPHVTLARKVKRKITTMPVKIEWFVNSFVLVESISECSGVKYRIIEEWPLDLSS